MSINIFGKSHVSFHTPGHSGEAYKGRDFFLSDVTELSFTDNLLCPNGKIEKLNEDLATIYDADFAFCVTNGATSCITTAVSCFRGTCLVVGNAHRSFFNVARKNRIKVVIASDTKKAREYLAKNKVDFAFTTYPDYFGRDLGIKEISSLLKEKDIPLIIDSAHGSHFALSPKLPDSATEYGDLVIYSLHKTLPVLTGGAVIVGKKQYKEKVFLELISTHSTSPSFMTLESISWLVQDLEKVKSGFDTLVEVLEEFKKDLENTTSFCIKTTDDPTRVCIENKNGKDIGYNLGKYLETKNIYVETSYKSGVILITTPYNMKHLGLVVDALKNAPDIREEKISTPEFDGIKVVEYTLADYEEISVENALGRRLYLEVGAYPPGTPSYFFGDIIDEQFISFFREHENFLFGACKGKIFVLK